MSPIPELLYELGAKDRHITWLDPFIVTREVQGTAATQEVAIDLPDDRALLLYNACARSQVLGAENTDLVFIQLQRGTGGEEFTIASGVMSPGFQRQNVNWQGSIIIPNAPAAVDPLRLRMIAAFTGAVNTKILNFTVFGLLVPLGNIQRSL